MFGISFKVVDETKRVQQAADKAAFRNFSHAAASISKDVKSTLVKASGPSMPGEPPHTHRGTYLKRAVRYAADKAGAIIGTLFSVVGEAGATHEFGEERGGVDFPERPFMGPALERAIPRFAGEWQGSIGN